VSTHAKNLASLLTIGGRQSWMLPELASLNRLLPTATLARSAARVRNLDGRWEFRLAARPEDAPRALDAKRGWHEVEVPGLWTMQGFGRPHYTNVVMPFPDLPPHVPEQNETGIYRRAFTIPRGWRSRPVVLHFGGAEGVLYVLVNGEPVGIAKDSRTPAEFDITDLVTDQNGKIVAVLIGSGGVLGIGQKDLAIRFEDVKLTRDENNNMKVMVNIDQQTAASAPDYETLDEQQITVGEKGDREHSTQ